MAHGDAAKLLEATKEPFHQIAIFIRMTVTLSMMEKGRKQRIRDWVERTEENPDFQTAMKGAGVVSVWMGGRFALGLEGYASEKFRLIVQTASRQPLDGDARSMLKQRLMGMYDRAIDLSEHFEAGSPDDALELIVR